MQKFNTYRYLILLCILSISLIAAPVDTHLFAQASETISSDENPTEVPDTDQSENDSEVVADPTPGDVTPVPEEPTEGAPEEEPDQKNTEAPPADETPAPTSAATEEAEPTAEPSTADETEAGEETGEADDIGDDETGKSGDVGEADNEGDNTRDGDLAVPLAPQTFCQIHIGDAGDNNPYTYTFSASSHNITSFTWDFGADAAPGAASGAGPHNVTYSSPGLKQITLNCDALPQIGAQVNISSQPTPNFTLSPATYQGTLPATITATNTSSPGGLTYEWEIISQPASDSTVYGTSTETNPTFSLNGYGTYTIQLTATDGGGQSASITQSAVVNAFPPSATLNVSPKSGISPLAITFSGIDQGGGPIDTWQFQITGPGGFNESDTFNAPDTPTGTTTLSATGTYTVALTYIGPGGSNFTSREVVVGSASQSVVAGFSYVVVGGTATEREVCFTNESTGPVVTSEWNFDWNPDHPDRPTEVINDATFCRTFSVAPGSSNYSVRLAVYNDAGGFTTATQSFTLFPLPSASFTASPSGTITWGQLVSFTSTSTGTITAYSWNFNGLETSSQQNPQNIAIGNLGGGIQIGPNLIELTVTGPGGSDTASMIIYVQTLPITCDITGDLTIIPPGALATYTGAVNNLNGRSATYNWNLTPGGLTENNDSFTVDWSALGAGTYLLTFAASTSDGASCERSLSIGYDYQPVDCQISGPTAILPDGTGNTYEATVLNVAGRTVTYEWFVDDVSQGTGATFSFSTTDEDTFTIRYEATVTDSGGGSVNCEEPITVTAEWPSLSFDLSGPGSRYPGQNGTYTTAITGDLAGRTVMEYRWFITAPGEGETQIAGAEGDEYTFSSVIEGTYNLRVEVELSSGQVLQDNLNILVAWPAVGLNVGGPATGIPGGSGSYSASITGDLAGRTVEARRWYVTVPREAEAPLGETGKSLNYTFNDGEGAYTLRSEWDLSDGSTVQDSHSTTVTWPPVGLNVGGPATGIPGGSGSYSASIAGDLAGRTVEARRWYVTVPGEAEAPLGETGESLNYTFNDGEGAYTLRSEWDLSDGSTVQDSHSTNVTWPSLSLTVTGPGQRTPGQSGTYNANVSGTLAGRILVYSWYVTDPDGVRTSLAGDVSSTTFSALISGGYVIEAEVEVSAPADQGGGLLQTLDNTVAVTVAWPAITCPISGPANPVLPILPSNPDPHTFSAAVTATGAASFTYEWTVTPNGTFDGADSGTINSATGNPNAGISWTPAQAGEGANAFKTLRIDLTASYATGSPNDGGPMTIDESCERQVNVRYENLTCPVTGPASLLTTQGGTYQINPGNLYGRTPAYSLALEYLDGGTWVQIADSDSAILAYSSFSPAGSYRLVYDVDVLGPDASCDGIYAITVSNPTLTCPIPGGPTALLLEQEGSYSAAPVDPLGRTPAIAWTLTRPDSTEVTGTGATFDHIFDQSGVYTLAYTATYENPDQDCGNSLNINVDDVTFTCAGLHIADPINTLNPTLGFEVNNPSGRALDYSWRLVGPVTAPTINQVIIDSTTTGNGIINSTANLPTPFNADNYTLEFSVVDAGDPASECALDVQRQIGTLSASLTYDIDNSDSSDPDMVFVGDTVCWISESSSTVGAAGTYNIAWDLGTDQNSLGTQTSSDPDLTCYQYTEDGTHTVTFTASTLTGSFSTSSTASVRVYDVVSLSFTRSGPTSYNSGQTFTPVVSGMYDDLTWTVVATESGDPADSLPITPLTQSIDEGLSLYFPPPASNPPYIDYTVTVSGIDQFGDLQEYQEVIRLFNPGLSVSASFTPDPLIGEVPLTVCFTDASTASAASPLHSWEWDFGNGETLSYDVDNIPAEICITYTEPGVRYDVNLAVTNTFGLTGEALNFVETYVLLETVANFAAVMQTNDSYCFQPLLDSGFVVTEWRFGDGTVITPDPADPNAEICHSYAQGGVYMVEMDVTDGTRSGTISQSVSVIFEAAQAGAMLAVTAVCTVDNDAVFTVLNDGGPMTSADQITIRAADGSVILTDSLLLGAGERRSLTVSGREGAVQLATGGMHLTALVDCLADLIELSPPAVIGEPVGAAYPPSVPDWSTVETCGHGCPPWLLYHTNENGFWEIFRLDGVRDDEQGQETLRTNLTHGASLEADDMSPSRSPNNEWIVFTSNRDTLPDEAENWELYIAHISGDPGLVQRLTYNTVARDINPMWGPNNFIVFQTTRHGTWDLYVIDMATGLEYRVTDSAGNDTNPHWSPDGQQIVFQSDRDGGQWQLYTVDLPTLRLTRLSDGSRIDVDPQFAPDGRTIAYRSYAQDGAGSVLYTMDVFTRQSRSITSADLDATNQAWSPSGAYLAFQGDDGQQLNVYVYEVASGSLRQLTDQAVADYAPTWRCADDVVVFTSDASDTPDIFEALTLPIDAPPIPVLEGAERLTFEPFDNIYPQNTPVQEFASREGQTVLGVFGEQTAFLGPDTSLTRIDLSLDGLIRDDWREVNSCPVD
jgi:Tol biopolymer transport system component